MVQAATPSIHPPTRPKDWHDRKPIKELDARGRALVEAMVFGVDEDLAAKHGVEANTPLKLEIAADVVGLRRRNARWLFTQPVFLSNYSKALSAIRTSAKARALYTMQLVMDDPGENTAADRTCRLKAANAIVGEENRASGGINVNINTGPQITAGLVIRLPDGVSAPPLERGEPGHSRIETNQFRDQRMLPVIDAAPVETDDEADE